MSEEIKNEAVSEEISSSFIDDFIIEDLAEGGRCEGMKVHTRFPPEPNGYLHIGHAKAIYVDFGTAERFNGICNLRMDDTNPTKEDVEYVDAIKEDIHWLGYDWEDRFYYASDYFEDMYNGAVELIKKGLAYVCELTPDQMREMRGDLTTPAQSPYRDRPMEESLDLFARMRAGEFEDGRMTLRAKIDLASGNFNMRDPVIYRINHMHAPSHRCDKWCIYPMYDFAHPIEDAMEGVTHSLCSLEFEDPPSAVRLGYQQRHAARKAASDRVCPPWHLTNTVMSKRKLRRTRRRRLCQRLGRPEYAHHLAACVAAATPPASIRNFSVRNGVSKVNSTVEYSFLEHCLREDLNLSAKRVMGVLNPVKLILTNYPEDRTETFEVENNPNRPEDGTRTVTFGRELYIEAEDFMETPVKGYFRLFPGNEVRLKTTYVVKCTGCKKDENGNVVEVYAEYDPESRGGNPADGRKIKSTIHWVDAKNAEDAEIRLYDNLFTVEDPDAGDFLELLNPDSLKVLTGCKVEAGLKTAKPGESFQFMRQGYFCVDNKDSAEDHLVFNRSVSLKDGFKKKK